LPPVQTPYEGAMTGYNVVFDDRPPAEVASKPTLLSLDDEDDGRPLQLEADKDDEATRTRPAEPDDAPPYAEAAEGGAPGPATSLSESEYAKRD